MTQKNNNNYGYQPKEDLNEGYQPNNGRGYNPNGKDDSKKIPPPPNQGSSVQKPKK